MRKGCLALLLTALLAGCLKSAPDDVDRPADADVALGTLVALEQCAHTCFEPTLVVGPNGTLYVTAGSDAVWRGEVAGAGYTWTNITPSPGDGLPGDRIVDVSASGRIFVSELSIGSAGATAVRVVASDDKGASWPVEHVFANAELGLSLDRQWLGFGLGDAVVVTYKNQADGLYLHRSTDGGDTFDAGQLLSVQARVPGGIGPLSGRASIIAGAPVVDDAGGVLVPLFHPMVLDATATGLAQGGLAVVQSTDAARPPVEFPVLIAGAQATGDFFPRLVRVGDVHWLSWKSYDNALHLAYTQDLAQWTAAQPPTHGALTASPWLLAGVDGILHLAWTEGAPGASHLMHAVQDGGAWSVTEVGSVPGDEARPGHTDFAHFGLDGAMALFPVARGNATGIEVVRVPG